MRNLLIITLVATLGWLPNAATAQVDDARMDKDLRVASKVLETLTQGETRLMMYNDNVEGNYIEGYGVIFSIGGGYSVFVAPKVPKMSYGYTYKGKDGTVYVSPKTTEEAQKMAKEAQEVAKQAQKMAVEAQKEAQEAMVLAEEGTDFEEIMVEFLADYSQMIGQLKPTDKIVISTKKSDYLYVMWEDDEETDIGEGGSKGMTAEMLKGDHNDYMAGKLTRDQLIKRIKINNDNGESVRSKDLDLFGSMIKTVYDQSYTDSYFVTWKPDYQRLTGVGAIYAFKVYSSYDENGLYRMPGIDESGLTGKQRNEKVEELYPIFVKSMKENIVQYGRTINSLKPDEMVIMKVTLTKCDDCSIPKKIQFSVKQSVLADFNAGKINQKDAVAQVSLSEIKR